MDAGAGNRPSFSRTEVDVSTPRSGGLCRRGPDGSYSGLLLVQNEREGETTSGPPSGSPGRLWASTRKNRRWSTSKSGSGLGSIPCDLFNFRAPRQRSADESLIFYPPTIPSFLEQPLRTTSPVSASAVDLVRLLRIAVFITGEPKRAIQLILLTTNGKPPALVLRAFVNATSEETTRGVIGRWSGKQA